MLVGRDTSFGYPAQLVPTREGGFALSFQLSESGYYTAVVQLKATQEEIANFPIYVGSSLLRQQVANRGTSG
jgi:hypothetical protein